MERTYEELGTCYIGESLVRTHRWCDEDRAGEGGARAGAAHGLPRARRHRRGRGRRAPAGLDRGALDADGASHLALGGPPSAHRGARGTLHLGRGRQEVLSAMVSRALLPYEEARVSGDERVALTEARSLAAHGHDPHLRRTLR